jgi:SAM-dependent methyltransferase
VSGGVAEMMQEVHRWRGSPEQQAVRDRVRKLGQFSFFDRQLGHPDWRGKNVLDFGGSDGNLLRNPECAIAPENYYCLDVVRNAVEEGRQAFPRAHWFHYDCYNCSFNPGGVPNLPVPDLGVAFDFILAYSVFTHTTREEMHGLVSQLRARLAPGGVLAFTFEDPHYQPFPEEFDGSNLRWRLETVRERRPELDVERLAEEGRAAQWCALVDGASLHVNANGEWRDEASHCLTYDVFYTAELMQREFPDAVIRPPVNGEMQHCCIVGAER